VDLFLDHGPCIKSLHPRAQPFGRGNGLQPGNAHADNKYPGRLQGARRGHHHGQHLVQPFRRNQHCHVARQVGLGTEHVHFLGQRGPGNHLHGNGIHTALHQCVQNVMGRKGFQVADMQRARLHTADFVQRRFAHPNHRVGPGQKARAVIAHGCTRLHVQVIRKTARRAEPRFNVNIGPQFHQPRHGLRGCRRARLPEGCFFRNKNMHGLFLVVNRSRKGLMPAYTHALKTLL